ncbi:hypothetical protein [Brachybacterium ginsengisoli]|uniref:hypothetical protein n=1 Tax=Brachybacterium ginsengisoli TaxID=1331682 RepID=UPI001475BA0E|nr:hypothetical protein [Brachybacterium ginsengisoli]
MDEETEAAGEAACWLGLLCPQCGAMPEGDGPLDPERPCWRCGAVPPRGSAGDSAGAG